MEFDPSPEMLTAVERLEGLRSQLYNMTRAAITKIVEQLAQENPGHEVRFSNSMGSFSVEFVPPLESADGEYHMDVVGSWDLMDRHFHRRYEDCSLHRRAFELFEQINRAEEWFCEATGLASGELGDISRGLIRR